MEGAAYAALAAGLDSLLAGRRCRLVLRGSPGSLVLVFGEDAILVSHAPGSPGVRRTAAEGGQPVAEPWNGLLAGSVVTSVSQRGLDRVLDFRLERRAAYRRSEAVLTLEAAGRNSNLVLHRAGDSRILACARTVTGSMSRVRTVSPGARYAPPPPTGLPPSRWGDPDVRSALDSAGTPEEIYRLLDGVGPRTAAAVLAEASSEGVGAGEIVARLAAALASGSFYPWAGPWGLMPVPLGPGGPVDDILAFREPEEGPGPNRAAEGAAGDGRRIRERMARLRALLEERPAAATLRRWGELLLANASAVRPGMESVVLPDWDGTEVEIPLRRGRTAAENAARFFRRASSSDDEAARIRARIGELEEELSGGDRGGGGRPAPGGREAAAGPSRARTPVDLGMGWICWVGRNARDNDDLTFGHARRDDWWLHARGTPGPHVILRGDARSGNPPAPVLLRAAELAASRCGSGVVPVDVVPVRHVRRMKGGRPGEVVYSGERTLFVGRGAGGTRRAGGTKA